jgi:hypothetical protein
MFTTIPSLLWLIAPVCAHICESPTVVHKANHPLILLIVSAAIFTPAMWGFNVSFDTFPYDNRPVAPLADYTFEQWWFHGHLGYPPNPGDFFDLPAGKPATAELACNKGATSYCAADGGLCFGKDNYPCPGSPTSQFHSEW